jgi:FkbM family methyltransferase
MNPAIIKVLYRANYLKHLNVNSHTRVNGLRVEIPVLNGVGFDNLPVSELWMCDLIRYVFKQNQGIFIDIGVNVGQTLIKVRSIDPERHYIGFEPNPECVHYINRLVKINDFKNVELFPVGIFDRNSILTLKLYTESSADQGASLIDNFREGEVFSKLNVPVFDYAHIDGLKNFGEIAMIKIDVEGAELEVLSSLKSTITDRQPVVLVEILPAYSNAFADRIERQNKIALLMQELDYKIFRVHKDQSKDKVAKLERISSFEIHGDIDYSDYALVPAALSEKMANQFNS